MNLAPGSRLGPYEIVGLLGAGGMGEVYRARDPRLGRDVAIKVLPATFATDPDRLQRFEQEARATAALNDSNIVAVYDVGTAEGQPYVVTELLDGETLRAALADGPLPLRKALTYAQQIARGLAAAHRRGIVHRDLKPENLFVTADGLVKILDFGLAKLSEAAGTTRSAMSTTAAGLVLGTVGYMSPEQARGELADHRADIFSFGAVLYEMLAGQRAFQGNSPAETLSAILKEQPPDLTLVVPGLSLVAGAHRRSLPGEVARRPVPDRGRPAVRARSDLRRLDAGDRRGAVAAPAVEVGGGRGRRGAGTRRRVRARPAPAGPGAAALPSAHLPSRRRARRAFHRRRSDHRLRGGVGRAADGAVLDPARRPRSAAAADDRHGPLRDVGQGRDGRGARTRRDSAASKARWPARRWPAARRGSWPRPCWPPTGGPTDRNWRSSAAAAARTSSSIRSDARSTIPARATSPISASRPAATPWPSWCIRSRATPPARWRWSTSRAGRRRCRPAGTACSAWPGRPMARRSGSPARAPGRRRRCTR